MESSLTFVYPYNIKAMPTMVTTKYVSFVLGMMFIFSGGTFSLSPQHREHISSVSMTSTTAQSCGSHGRRHLLSLSFLSVATSFSAYCTPAQALDVDAFMSQELIQPSSDSQQSNKKLSDDQALCKLGQPSKARGDACVRAGMSTLLKTGGVDAYGNVDRGDYKRCKVEYVDDPNIKGFLKKSYVCN